MSNDDEKYKFVNCNEYALKYHTCVKQAKDSQKKLVECRKILRYFEFCQLKHSLSRDQENRSSNWTKIDLKIQIKSDISYYHLSSQINLFIFFPSNSYTFGKAVLFLFKVCSFYHWFVVSDLGWNLKSNTMIRLNRMYWYFLSNACECKNWLSFI